MADNEKFQVGTDDEKRVLEINQINVHLVRLTPLTAPPTDVRNGDMWVTDSGDLKIRLAGATKTVTVT